MMAESKTGERDLAALVATLENASVAGDLARVATAVTIDSRAVRPGALFVAIRGERSDGHAFVGEALAAGACAVVVARDAVRDLPNTGATIVSVDDTRRALSRLAATFFGDPSRALAAIGVTGTNGKTTTVHLVRAILETAGVPTGCLGTLGASFGATSRPLARTTPLAPDLHALLAEMRDAGAAAVALEVSSHALALDRVADVAFAVGVLTNVTRDHLDFHETIDAYAAAKRKLFEQSARSIFNVDDAYGRRFADEFARAGAATTTYGLAPDAEVRATDVVADAGGSAFSLDGRRFALPLPGRFNVQNALAAIAVARTRGVSDDASARALAAFAGVPGRMERFAGGGVTAIVDYAHTPDALDVVLTAAREMRPHALAVVFGCGGDRDAGKRAEMGRVAGALADRIYLTNDNPRGERPQAIVDDVRAGIGRETGVAIDLDRRAAIRRAIGEASAGDVVVIAGKGHENYQIAEGVTAPFDDRDEARAALAARAAKLAV